jgi:hypothetical protein
MTNPNLPSSWEVGFEPVSAEQIMNALLCSSHVILDLVIAFMVLDDLCRTRDYLVILSETLRQNAKTAAQLSATRHKTVGSSRVSIHSRID